MSDGQTLARSSRDAVRGRRRTAPRAVETSDVSRLRGVMAAAAVAGLVLLAGVWLSTDPAELGVARPLSLPHRSAGLTCASCHGGEGGAGPADPSAALQVPDATCRTCHAGKQSARVGHRRLAERGALTCTTCHKSHVSDGGVVITPAGGARRYGVGTAAPEAGLFAGVYDVVPSPTASACAGCHRLDSARDPIQRCLIGGAAHAALGEQRPIACFDEHRVSMSTAALTRWALWEQARAALVAEPVPPVEADVGEGDEAPAGGTLTWIGLALLAGLLTLLATRLLAARRRRRAQDRRAAAAPILRAPEVKRLPRINTTTCIGCHACVDVCPYDVLEVQRYVARVVRPDDCCGLTLCEQRCPNGSLVVLDTEPASDLPALDDDLQSNDRPGVYMAGDITGLPLIRNAINQGAHAVRSLAHGLPKATDPDVLDVVIVGAGPAGISATLAAKDKGLRYATVDQDTVAASIRSFPRGKLVFDQPLGMPVIGDLWLRESTKEELLAKWLQVIHRERLEIREGQRVEAIEDVRGGPPLGHFRVQLVARDGARSSIEARRVVLAFGRRGTPRKLAVEIPDAMESHVHYSLADARSFAGRRALVVGLGDVAMETAIALARQPDTTVHVSYRGDDFKRGKRRNMDELRRLANAGRVTLMMGTEVERVDGSGEVTLRARDGGAHAVQCDAMFVMIGNLPPWPFLERLGVRRADVAAAG